MNKRKLERHERMYGPHFNEECAQKVVNSMKNEDGTKGAHWSLEQAMTLAQQYGVNFSNEQFNKYDWYVALNMIYSDFYKAVVTITNSDHIRYYVELAKAWLKDKDVDEGKMWYYYKYVMCDEIRDDYDDYEEYDDDDEYDEYPERRRSSKHSLKHNYVYDDDFEEDRLMRKPTIYDRIRYL